MNSRWKAVCAYDGTDYNGWQSQVDGRSVQDVIERRLKGLFKKQHRIHGSGRTDAGTHASGQVFHFDCDWPKDAAALRHAIQTGLPESIQIKTLRSVKESFHARFSATGKVYRYQLHIGQAPPHLSRFCWSCPWSGLNVDQLERSLALFRGWHDFRSFCANPGVPYEDTRRYIAKIDLSANRMKLSIRVEGSGFLYKMVRSMVGGAVAVGCDRLSFHDFENLLKGSMVRGNLVPTAPAKGLSLEKVFYRPRHYPELPDRK